MHKTSYLIISFSTILASGLFHITFLLLTKRNDKVIPLKFLTKKITLNWKIKTLSKV